MNFQNQVILKCPKIKKAILTAFLMVFVLSGIFFVLLQLFILILSSILAQSLPQKQLDELNLKIDAVENKMDIHIHSLEGQIEELKEVFEGQMEKLKQTMEEQMADLRTMLEGHIATTSSTTISTNTTTSPRASKGRQQVNFTFNDIFKF